MVEAKKELTVRELLENTYSQLAERNTHKTIVLPEKALSEIANDSDWHRTRVGYMGYENVNLFRFNGKTFVVGKGEACGGYPAEPYDSDILALEIDPKKKTKDDKLRKKTDKQLAEDIVEAISITDYFRNSLIIGMDDGRIAGNKKSQLYVKLAELIKGETSSFIAKEMEIQEGVLTMDLRPVVTSGVRYKPKFVDYLVEQIESILKG